MGDIGINDVDVGVGCGCGVSVGIGVVCGNGCFIGPNCPVGNGVKNCGSVSFEVAIGEIGELNAIAPLPKYNVIITATVNNITTCFMFLAPF